MDQPIDKIECAITSIAKTLVRLTNLTEDYITYIKKLNEDIFKMTPEETEDQIDMPITDHDPKSYDEIRGV